jgi:hypothetical protein
MTFVFVYFLKVLLKRCTALSLNRLIFLFITAILGCHFSTRRDDHVILCSTFEFLFDFQNRIFLEVFVRLSNCSNIKPFETSRVHCIYRRRRIWPYAVYETYSSIVHVHMRSSILSNMCAPLSHHDFIILFNLSYFVTFIRLLHLLYSIGRAIHLYAWTYFRYLSWAPARVGETSIDSSTHCDITAESWNSGKRRGGRC